MSGVDDELSCVKGVSEFPGRLFRLAGWVETKRWLPLDLGGVGGRAFVIGLRFSGSGEGEPDIWPVIPGLFP